MDRCGSRGGGSDVMTVSQAAFKDHCLIDNNSASR
jgi:hypothetical protein